MVIRWIGRHPGISSGQLAAALHLDAGTISTALARMERKGLLRRRRDPADGRRVMLELTPIGRRLDRPTANTVESAVQRLIDSAEPPAIDRSLALLADLTEVLDATGSRKIT
jgi:DNA-binding MarR family transcriptional regulator